MAYIIKLLVDRGKTVLLTSYTHTAVDNLLLKLKEYRVDFIRLGRVEHIHTDLKQHILDYGSISTTASLDGTFQNTSDADSVQNL